jgi:hypothetical protein
VQVVLFAVPGAFTPTCSKDHAPGFISNAEQLKAKGVDTIACVSVNDPFVMGAWAKDLSAGERGRKQPAHRVHQDVKACACVHQCCGYAYMLSMWLEDHRTCQTALDVQTSAGGRQQTVTRRHVGANNSGNAYQGESDGQSIALHCA